MTVQCIVHVLIPELFAYHTLVTPGLRLEALERLLSRAYIEDWAQDDFMSTLGLLFGLAGNSLLPVAPITRLYDAHDSQNAVWLRADPVYLQADRDRLLLIDAQAISLTQTEAEYFITHLNQFYQQKNFEFSAPHPKRWYLRLSELPQLITYPVNQVLGRDIHAYMPSGDDKMAWRQRLNEIQMLLHQLPLNSERQQQAQLPINSVWFWGLGHLPSPPARRWAHVWSDNPLACGLAELTQTPVATVPHHGREWLTQLTAGEHLLTLEAALTTPQNWNEWLITLDNQWLNPLFEALKRRQIDMLALYPCYEKVFVMTPERLRHWWRKRQHWQRFFPAPPPS
ncbi:MAG: hypothetical protein SVR94_10185 [Pseudomonadota bacterium]|nr:hypothetical protein [Pseudomonadota bacterium]